MVKRRQSFVILGLLVVALVSGGCLAKPTRQLGDHVITGAETWSGRVLVDGVVTVKKGARLVIAPGAEIRFVRRDRDGDGIGDGELLVEGSLLARGTATAPILLTSAAARPAAADWKYLYLDFAEEAEIAHLISEYAYSGLQIHFCRARVVDSLFRHNVDGVRFSTVGLLLAGNRMINNRHGLRYEERGSRAEIHHNEISGNEIGIFAVTRSEDRARIEFNNIVGNSDYSVKLGLEQWHDISMAHNWWGTTDRNRIGAGVLDARIDSQLGQLKTPEPLSGPVDISAWKDGQQ